MSSILAVLREQPSASKLWTDVKAFKSVASALWRFNDNGLDAKGTAAYQVTRLTSSFSKPLSGTADINDQDDHYYLTAHEQNKQVKC
jgi:hypothetical protein